VWIFELKNTSQLSRWEKGISAPNGKNLLMLSILYRTPINAFYSDEDCRELRKHIFEREELLKETKRNEHAGII
jgi:transcriptional regulator with XRE-family HTH domain